jgi:hypothetical protein
MKASTKLQKSIVGIDIYKTSRAKKPSVKRVFETKVFNLNTVEDVINKIREEFPKAHKISVYDGDTDFLGNF